jgi:hypothetical protein
MSPVRVEASPGHQLNSFIELIKELRKVSANSLARAPFPCHLRSFHKLFKVQKRTEKRRQVEMKQEKLYDFSSFSW